MNTPVACPEIGVWRAWLDRETQGDPAVLAEHLNCCQSCERLLAELLDTSAVASAALRGLPAGAVPSTREIALARERLGRSHQLVATTQTTPTRDASAQPLQEHHLVIRSSRLQHWRVAASGAAAALILAFAVATPQGQAAAASFLSNFRSTQIQPVPVTSTDIQSLNRSFSQLQNLGTVQGQPDVAALQAGRRPENVTATTVASIDEANKSLPFTVKVPDLKTLPGGVASTPKVQLIKAQDLKFTFDTTKAAAYYKSKNQNVALPAKFNGATLVVTTPAAVMLEYGDLNTTAGQPSAGAKEGSGGMGNGLIIGESGELAISVQGGDNVSLDDVRQFLLSLPDFPDPLKTVLLNPDWQNTLPLPIPIDKVQWSQTTVSGAAAGQGLLLNDNSGVGSAMIWHSGPAGQGQIYGVAGPDKARVIQNVANNLH